MSSLLFRPKALEASVGSCLPAAILCFSLLTLPVSAFAYSSGSTGADGALAPTVNTEVVLPASGVLNYSSINIPAGVVVTFKPNANNTPVVLLVSGNATIAGTVDVSGRAAAASGSAGDGVLADDGIPGSGGPGGYPGGRGGRPGGAADSTDRSGGKGLGPGGGLGGLPCLNEITNGWQATAGSGGGYGGAGGNGGTPTSAPTCPSAGGGGPAYGAEELQPLLGGSGGGGGRTRGSVYGSGGGGGGGALLIAVSGALTVSGQILARGGSSNDASVASCTAADYVGAGGGGSGGAIRLVATALAGNGTINADGGAGGGGNCGYNGGGGGSGRIRLEAETITRTSGTSPFYSFGQPQPALLATQPTLRIVSIAGVAVPAAPTGVADVRLPENQANPVTIALAAAGIPVGTTISVRVTPNSGAEVAATSTALAGSEAASTASASLSVPLGGSTVQAFASYSITVALGESLSRFAGNERVSRITVSAGLDGRSTTTLVTVTGREYKASPEALRMAALGG